MKLTKMNRSGETFPQTYYTPDHQYMTTKGMDGWNVYQYSEYVGDYLYITVCETLREVREMLERTVLPVVILPDALPEETPAEEPAHTLTAMTCADLDSVDRSYIRNMKTAVEVLTAEYMATRDATPAETVAVFVRRVGYDVAVATLATLVNRYAWDGRISRRCSEWAARIPSAFDADAAVQLFIYSDRIHRAHLDQLAEALMQYIPTEEPAEAEAVSDHDFIADAIAEDTPATLTASDACVYSCRITCPASGEVLEVLRVSPDLDRVRRIAAHYAETLTACGRCVVELQLVGRDGSRHLFDSYPIDPPAIDADGNPRFDAVKPSNLTYAEFIELARKHAEHGGRAFVENITESDYPTMLELWPRLTEAEALEMFARQAEIDAMTATPATQNTTTAHEAEKEPETMTSYSYLTATTENVVEYIRDQLDYIRDDVDTSDRDALAEFLNDELWVDDGVTGNASGSYTFNRARAREYVLADFETVAEALREFCVEADEIGRRFLSEDWEWLDVTARCYVLGQAIEAALDQLAEELTFAAEGEED